MNTRYGQLDDVFLTIIGFKSTLYTYSRKKRFRNFEGVGLEPPRLLPHKYAPNVPVDLNAIKMHPGRKYSPGANTHGDYRAFSETVGGRQFGNS